MTNRFFAGQTNFIEELNALDGESGDAQQAIDDHIADTTGAHAASAISNTPAGNIAATTVQAAINELDAAKANLAGAAFTGAVSATSFTGPLSGNASTATTLATARNINGVSFNGSADITVTAAAGTLTGATLAAGVTASSLTSVGTLTALTVSGQSSFAAGTAAAPSVKVGAEQNGLYSSAANTLDVTLGGVRQFQFSRTASAVNYFSVTGSAAGGAPTISAVGTDANINLTFAPQGASGLVAFDYPGNGTFFVVRKSGAGAVAALPEIVSGTTGLNAFFGASANSSDSNVGVTVRSKGTAAISLMTNQTVEQFRVGHVANAVNRVTAYGNGTGLTPGLFAEGSDANIGLGLYSKAAGPVFTAVRGAVSAYFDNPASAVNYWLVSGSAAGGFSNILEAAGADANIQNLYASKGTYGHMFRTNGSGGQTQFLIAHAPSAVNYYQVQGAATAGAPVFFATGSDVNVSAIYSLKGAGNHVFYTATTTAPQLIVAHTASAVNYLQVTGSATGNAVTISAQGSDTNIDFAITPKGTGNVRFGTHSAIAAETVTGYITIKDSSGTERKLAVLS